MRSNKLALLGTVFMLAGCGREIPNDVAADQAAISQLIMALYELEADCTRQGPNGIDLPDATSFGINAREVINKNDPGADAREEELCAAGGGVRFVPTIGDVVVFTDNAAIAYGTSSYEEIAGDGGSTLVGEFNWTQVLKRSPEGWRIQHTHIAPLFLE